MKKLTFALPCYLGALLTCSSIVAMVPCETTYDVTDDILAEKLVREKSDEEDETVFAEEDAKAFGQNKIESLFVNEAFMNMSSTYTTFHRGAFQHASAVSGSGNHVFLDNGTGWMIAKSDEKKTLDWTANHHIIITPAPWYSSYTYILFNHETNAHVKADLKEIPSGYNEYLFWISEVDAQKGNIILNDQTVWTVPYSYCREQLKNWYPGQRVAIGINGADSWVDSWVTKKAPNILYSLEKVVPGFIKAKCEY